MRKVTSDEGVVVYTASRAEYTTLSTKLGYRKYSLSNLKQRGMIGWLWELDDDFETSIKKRENEREESVRVFKKVLTELSLNRHHSKIMHYMAKLMDVGYGGVMATLTNCVSIKKTRLPTEARLEKREMYMKMLEGAIKLFKNPFTEEHELNGRKTTDEDHAFILKHASLYRFTEYDVVKAIKYIEDLYEESKRLADEIKSNDLVLGYNVYLKDKDMSYKIPHAKKVIKVIPITIYEFDIRRKHRRYMKRYLKNMQWEDNDEC